jgi:hypothetical protein
LSQPVRRLSLCAFTAVLLIVLALWLMTSAVSQEDKPPRYEVDASWPKSLPNYWLIGQVGGLAVDKHDHIWVNQRPRSLTDDEKGAIPNPPTRTERRSLCWMIMCGCQAMVPRTACCWSSAATASS